MYKIKSSLFLTLIVLSLSSCFNRIGKLTMVSTRNVDSKMGDYRLLQKDVVGKAKTKKDDALEIAIDNAVKQEPQGEFMKNVIVSVSSSGKKIKVQGDVWGYETVDKNVTKSVNADVKFEIGNKVTFKQAGKITEGIILGLNTDKAVVEYKNLFGKMAKIELAYEELTKIGN